MLSSVAIFLTLVAGVLYGLHYLVRGGRKGELIDRIPGPHAWPIIGNILTFIVPPKELWNVARRMNKDYYPIHRIWSIVVPVVTLYHPDDVEALFSSVIHIEKSYIYNFLHPWLGTGLLTSGGKKWHERRRILTPAFHFNVLQQFVGIFNEQSEKLVQSLCLQGDEVVDDLVHLLHKYTLNSICETAMGATSDLNGQVQNEYRSCVSEIGDIALYRLLRPWWHLEWMFKISQKFKEQVRALKVLHGFSTNIINDRKRYHDETGGRFLKGLGGDSDSSIYDFNDENVKGKRRLAMLDLLISASRREGSISDEGIREEVDTFIFEGHDTTAMGLCFTLMLLAENKDIQDKARAEVDEVFEGKEDKKLSMREVQGLAYLERCIKESLRLFPSVPFITRYVSEDLQLKNYLVPGGTGVHVHIFELHRDSNFWPDPLVFNPDRFLPEQMRGRHPFAFVPFSAGPRNCIGQKFAMLELKVLMAHFLHNFYLEPLDLSCDVEIFPDLVLRPAKPVRLKFVRRSHKNETIRKQYCLTSARDLGNYKFINKELKKCRRLKMFVGIRSHARLSRINYERKMGITEMGNNNYSSIIKIALERSWKKEKLFARIIISNACRIYLHVSDKHVYVEVSSVHLFRYESLSIETNRLLNQIYKRLSSARVKRSEKMLGIMLFLTLIAGVLYGFHYLVRGGRKGELIGRIPGPYAWPFIGNTLMFLVSHVDLWKVMRKLNKDYCPINRVWTVKDPVVNVYHPDDVEALFSSVRHIEKSFLYDFIQPWFNTGLLTSKGRKWHERRRILTPAFHFNVLQQFVGIFNEQSEKLVQSLCLEGDEVVDDLVHLLHKYTLNSICETTMGTTSDVNGQVQNEYRSCVSEMGDIMLYRILRPWWHSDWMFKFSRKFKDQVRALKVLHGFSTNIINDRKRYHDETGDRFLKGLGGDSDSSIYDFNNENVKGKRRLAMLDLLISASRREGSISDEGIREEVDTFIFEGHDTTAMGLCFTFMLLAENKQIQDKARGEVDEAFEGKEDKKLSMREVQGLAYLERCIKESLRLFPSVPFISRYISEDLQLKNYLVPGGTIVNVHIYDLHRDPNFWRDPSVFDPDRFLPGQAQGRHPFAFVPFSAGPRNCIGQKFAMLELKVLMAHFLHNFYFEPLDFSSDVQILPDLVLRPSKPIRMKFVPRSQSN
ncbi:uncharacterized protein LOC124408984 [Diprion similis]|uniref:uncharacterized protein LOC124408984 n=1 Tax=Diprion similis TaxID=362088 RepID=UPI001EF7A634|nr:uncharacterized protein LOC124408984 [Diprion similis]